MKILSIAAGDTLLLKKPHPCGSYTFRVLRTGSDIRLLCTTCGRDMMLPREKIEKNVRQIIPPPAKA